MNTLNDNSYQLHCGFRDAMHLLAKHTGGRFDIWALAGPHNAKARAEIASALAGRKVPQSRAGVTAIRDSLYAMVSPSGNCNATREDAFIDYARKYCNQ